MGSAEYDSKVLYNYPGITTRAKKIKGPYLPSKIYQHMKNNKQNKLSRIIISPASLVCVAIIFGFHIAAHSQTLQVGAPAVDIPGSQVRKLNSAIVGQEYELH